MRLLSSQGELVRGRCGATNLCAYCARLAAVENSELLALDALYGTAPTLWAVLTTRTASIEPKDFYDARRYLLRALRSRWPDVELAALVEFTTGYAGSSGGLRRPHWNLLVKGVPVEDVDEFAELVREVWCRHVDAEPQAQHVGEISDAGGLMRYIALHFQKESQAPPPGWRGHRFLKTRGYLWQPTPQAREAARAALREKRELHRQLARGLEAHDAELVMREALAIAAATTWRLYQLHPSTAGDGEPPSERMRRLQTARTAAARALLEQGEGACSPNPGGPTGRDGRPQGLRTAALRPDRRLAGSERPQEAEQARQGRSPRPLTGRTRPPAPPRRSSSDHDGRASPPPPPPPAAVDVRRDRADTGQAFDGPQEEARFPAPPPKGRRDNRI